MEFKSVQSKASIDGRTVTGIFSVLGYRDSYGDRVMPGAFKKNMAEGRARIRHLWNHDGHSPPIAKILDLYEIPRSDLPAEVIAHAPDASGGAVVVREYLKTPRADEVLAGVKAGAILEMSFAFDVPDGRADFKEETIGGEKVVTRYLREVKLYDTSDVNWGANDATLAARSVSLELVAANLKTLANEYRQGRFISPKDSELIQSIHDQVCDGRCQAKRRPSRRILDEADGLLTCLEFDRLMVASHRLM